MEDMITVDVNIIKANINKKFVNLKNKGITVNEKCVNLRHIMYDLGLLYDSIKNPTIRRRIKVITDKLYYHNIYDVLLVEKINVNALEKAIMSILENIPNKTIPINLLFTLY
jgi:hypothetical protein